MNNQKRALVTGASRGIGRAIAIALAADGFEVAVHYASNRTKADEVVALITEKGGKAFAVGGNLCDASAAKSIMADVGDVDVLVLNASVQHRRLWAEISHEEAIEQLQCNFLSSLQMIQLAAPAMAEKGWGRIITVGSVQERKPHPDMLVYSASKAAQTNMVQSLSLQLATSGITVNNVAPGVIYTDRNVAVLSDAEYAKKVTASIPVGFYGEPEDCAGMVSLLCSDAGRYITGQSIYVDGGKSVQ